MANTWVMRNKWIFFVAPFALAFFVWACGEIVMHLWNWLLPAIFGWHSITFWQGLGLLILCRMLFGSWGSGSDRNSRRHKAGRWEQMTPEERENFRQSAASGCGGFGAPATGPAETAP